MRRVTHRDSSRHHPLAHSHPDKCPGTGLLTLKRQVGPLDRSIVVFRAVHEAPLGTCAACPPWEPEHPAELLVAYCNRLGRQARRGTCQASFSELIAHLAGEADALLVLVPSTHPEAAALPDLDTAGDAA